MFVYPDDARSVFQYPNEMVGILRERWERAPGWLRPCALPSDEIIAELLGVTYHAGLLVEEQRRLSFRVLFATPDEIRGTASFEPIAFTTARPFSVTELVRLAPAADVTQIMICVRPSTSSATRLEIWGLLDAGSSWWALVRGESEEARLPPDFLTLIVTEPGRLVITRGGFGVMVYHQGRITGLTRSTLDAGVIAARFAPAVQALAAQVQGSLGEFAGSLEPDHARRFYTQQLLRLLLYIRERGHGGMILVVPDAPSVERPESAAGLRVKYPLNQDSVWGLLHDSLVSGIQAARHPTGDDGDAISAPAFWQFRTYQVQSRLHAEALTDCIKFVAALSAVDGAVVMTDRWRVLGFGAEVVAGSWELTRIRIALDSEARETFPLPMEAYGTRHRSAFRFCAGDPECVAFVVSQDGGVKAVAHQGTDVLMWPEVAMGAIRERFSRAMQNRR